MFASKARSSRLLAVVALGSAIFVWLALRFLQGQHGALDVWGLTALRDPLDPEVHIGPGWLTDIAWGFTALGSAGVAAGLTAVIGFYLALARERAAAAFVFACVGGGAVMAWLVKAFFEQARPHHLSHAEGIYQLSFPSGHALLAALVYLTLGAVLANLPERGALRLYVVTVAVGLTLVVGASRVYLSLHWPSDVLAGWALGGAWVAACLLVAGFLRNAAAVREALRHTER